MSFKITTLVLPAATLAAAMALPVTLDGQRGQQNTQMRFAAMDTNRDGAISRAEWRGNDRSFANGDIVLHLLVQHCFPGAWCS